MHATKATRRDVLSAFAALFAGTLLPTSRAHAQGTGVAAPFPVLVDNDKVRVYAVHATPGQSVLGAGLPAGTPRLAVFMSDAKVKLTQGGAVPKRANYKEGDMVWDAGHGISAENAGNGEASVYLVEPKGKIVAAAKHPDGAKGEPSSTDLGGKVLFENDSVRVIEHSARPRMGVCGEGMHTHPDHLTIVVRGGRIKITKPGAEPVIRDAPTGRVFWDPSGPHAIQNLGSRNTRSFLIEIKTA